MSRASKTAWAKVIGFGVLLIIVAAVICRGCGPSLFDSGSQSSPTKAVQATSYTVALVCADCAEIDMEINVWQKAGTSRGSVSFSAPHNTTVTVQDSKIADDGRRWYRVEYQGKTGWIAEDFVRR